MPITQTDDLRRLNEQAYNLAQAIHDHPAFPLLPEDYQQAVSGLFDASQDVHADADAVLDFGSERGGVEMGADRIEEGDLICEDGMDPVYVSTLGQHGMTILITDHEGGEITLDADTVVTIWRRS